MQLLAIKGCRVQTSLFPLFLVVIPFGLTILISLDRRNCNE